MITVTGIQQEMLAAEKARRKKDRAGRGLREEEPLTPAHALADGALDAQDGQDARKAYENRGITTGPGDFTEPGAVTPEDFSRPYISDGHASRSRVAGPPNVSPMPPQDRGIGQPLTMPGLPAASGTGPVVQTLAAHQARAAAAVPPAPVPGRSAP